MNIAIVVGAFDRELTDVMESAAVAQARKKGAKVVQILHVPGAFDAPFAVKRVLARNDVDGVAVLGAIIKGDTKHDEVIGFALAKQLMELSLEYDKPVTNGVIGPGATEADAKKRTKEYGERAVDALLELCDL